mgnify:FL=1|tara:strand:- start:4764 stop:5495 length:732 start_codon:yes stop_codon:yes gene_type:complete
MAKDYTFKEVWDTLSQVDVNEHTDEKQGLTYLSWAWAWGIMMKHYPEFEFSFYESEDNLPYVSLPDGSAEVRCTVTIGNLSRTQSLPLSVGFKPIINPNAFQINTAKQRCLTKCLGIYGLGHYIYAGEDLPQEDNSPVKKKTKPAPKKQEAVAVEDVPQEEPLLFEGEPFEPKFFVTNFLDTLKEFPVETKSQLDDMYKKHSQQFKLVQSHAPKLYEDTVEFFKSLKEQLPESTTEGEENDGK